MNKPFDLVKVEPEYVYVTIPAEYVCIYHRILAMLADYGEEMLKDCKAACKDRNSGVIECFNMFNAAVAAKKLGKDKLASLLINYIKAKINQIYQGKDNSTSFVFPVDENGQLKAFVSCGETPIFRINAGDMMLYKHKYGWGFDEHFKLGEEDEQNDKDGDNVYSKKGLTVELKPYWESIDNVRHACSDIVVTYAGHKVDIEDCIYEYYFDGVSVKKFTDVINISIGFHTFGIIVTYKDETKITIEKLYYGGS